jgi:uncharacterized membrane protein YfcA
MDAQLAIVCAAALLASMLTLYSGFGLGTLLMPVMALFVPLELAVASTALVHLANNLFKLAMLGRQAARQVLWRFGVPAVFGSLLGAALLGVLAGNAASVEYRLFGSLRQVTLVNLVIGALILVFVVIEMLPQVQRRSLGPRTLPVGGALSGFFGGLSGHQGALRSLFLLKAGLDARQFVATGVVLAVMVDVTRLAVYGWQGAARDLAVDWTLVISATLAAFAGAWLGARWLHKVTLRFVQLIVAALLLAVGAGLVTGLL